VGGVEDPERAEVVRRMVAAGVLTGGEPRLVLGGSTGAFELRDFLVRNRIPFDFRPDPGADAAVWCEIPGVATLVDPTVVEVARAIGLVAPPARERYDVVIVGAGPAGLAAAVYAASEGLSTAVVEALAPGGQAGTTSRIENYLGFPDGISGAELASRGRRQAERFGAEILLARRVVEGGGTDAEGHRLVLDDGAELRTSALVCATGVAWRLLDRPGVVELLHRGIYYGAAPGEAPGLRGKDVVIVGAGNSAGQAAMFFVDWARSITLVVRGARLSTSMSSYLSERIEAHPDITVRYGTEVSAALGDDWLRRVRLRTTAGGTSELPTEAMFVCIGGEPQTQWATPRGIQVDAAGYLLTGSALIVDPATGRPPGWLEARAPMPLETSLPALFAIGDVRAQSTKRVSTAVGEGAMVVKLVHELRGLGARRGDGAGGEG